MTDPLVTTAELEATLGSPDLRIVDGTWFLDGRDARAAWLEEHLPAAVFFDLEAVSDQASPLPHMLPQPQVFAAAAADLGVESENDIVVYDQQGIFSAARVWWMFRAMGARRVRVLDGGLPRWRREGRPLEAGPVAAAAATFCPAYRPELVRDLDAVAAELRDGRQVIDARPAPRFLGEAPEPRQGLRRGHMPGARNVPFGSLLTADGAMKPAAELRRVFAEAGIDPSRPATATCGSGVTAAIVVLALARLGLEDAAIYDGSWAEWGGRDDTPVATGVA